ncbi:MAG: NAD(P)/FAD-dependent oxidoreductase [Theionarchaea archaeon]|nr:NAD(P)/FAD-dependent oxidoreductase [Theionarchaea archaeon]
MDCVVIIGGGISGLLTALALQKEGKKVTIFEKGEVGNVVRSYKVEGDSGTYTVDTGPHILTRLSSGPLQQLMDAFFDVKPLFVPHGDYYLRMNNEHLKLPWALKEIMKFDVISRKERITLMKCIVEGILLKDKSITVQKFLESYDLDDATRRLIDALCYFLAGVPMSDVPIKRFWDSQKYKDGAATLPLRKMLNLLNNGTRHDQYYPVGGIQTLTNCILEGYTGDTILEEVIYIDPEKKYVSTHEGDYAYDFAVYAGMARELGNICELPSEYGDMLSLLKTTATLTVWVGTRDRVVKKRGSEIWIDATPQCWVVPTSLYDPALAPEGCNLLGFVFPYESESEKKALQSIESVYPDLSIDMVHFQVLQPDKAAWTTVNFPSVKTPFPDFYLVGTDTVKRSMGITRASYSVLELLHILRGEKRLCSSF